MRERPAMVTTRGSSHPPACSIDVIAVSTSGKQLVVLLNRAGERATRPRWELPWDGATSGTDLRSAAHRVIRERTGCDAAWVEQLGAYSDGSHHPSGAGLSVAYLALLPRDSAAGSPDGASWQSPSDVLLQAGRQRVMLEEGLAAIRTRMDHSPVAFNLLPPAFTLGDLQQMYELLLGRRLHKASFRRALQAASLVEPIDEWRREGRGRPAQLFRYVPRKRKRGPLAVRFDRLSSGPA